MATIKDKIPNYKWRKALTRIRELRKSVRLERRITGKRMLSNRQIRHIVLVMLNQHVTQTQVATLQHNLAAINENCISN